MSDILSMDCDNEAIIDLMLLICDTFLSISDTFINIL